MKRFKPIDLSGLSRQELRQRLLKVRAALRRRRARVRALAWQHKSYLRHVEAAEELRRMRREIAEAMRPTTRKQKPMVVTMDDHEGRARLAEWLRQIVLEGERLGVMPKTGTLRKNEVVV